VPKYPSRLSENRGDATTSLSHVNAKRVARRTEFETLYLPKVGWIAEHVNVEEFCNIDGPNFNILLFKRRPNKGRLFGNDGSLVGRRFTAPDGLDHVLEPPDAKDWQHLLERIQVQIVQIQIVQIHLFFLVSFLTIRGKVG
jgi:hypothetical protein